MNLYDDKLCDECVDSDYVDDMGKGRSTMRYIFKIMGG